MLVIVGIAIWQIRRGNVPAEDKGISETTTEPGANSLSTGVQPPRIKILEQLQTPTGRVAKVEIDGVIKEFRIPGTMNLSDEQILDLAAELTKKQSEEASSSPKVNRHLLFYGRVIDELGNVVLGAKIEGRVLVTEGRGDGGFKTVETLSDSTGSFSFNVAMGQQINVKASKEPEYLASPEQQFVYFRVPQKTIHQPDQASPVFFALTKKQPPEKLFELDKWWGAKNTGEPVHIDLTTGQRVAGQGDIIVSIVCPEPFKAGDKIPWKLTIQATRGGLSVATDERLDYMRMAPLAGYQAIEVSHDKNSPDWEPQFTKLFYLKARDGEVFAKLLFRMHTQWDERGVPFGFKAFVNVNGSRNLQGLP